MLDGCRARTADRRDIPDHMVSWSAYKAGQKKEGGNIQCAVFVFPGHCYMWQNLLSWTWLPVRSGETILHLTLLACAAFDLLFTLFMSTCVFHPSSSLPCPTGSE